MSPDRAAEDRAMQRTLLASYCPPAIRAARERQDEILVARFRGGRHAIADVGCGDGYHGAIFASGCRYYHGFEIAPRMAEMARQRWRREGLTNTRLFVGDVAETALEHRYDLVFCLYFTPGNFRDPSDDLSLYSDRYLDRNPAFVAVFSRFFRALEAGGKMFLTVYKDVAAAEAAQIDFYDNTGQDVITPPGSRFVATAQGFWSARFTAASMRSNLAACGIAADAITCHDLNEIAWLVEVEKRARAS